jgi:hypothetical protein
MPGRIELPCCDTEMQRPFFWPRKITGATFDCPNCNSLRIILDEDGTNKGLHEHLHEQDARWPKDGKDTYSVDVETGAVE